METERRMVGLSNSMSGLILNYKEYGNHLNKKRETIDLNLEKRNFAAAANVLTDRFNKVKYNGYETHCSYVEPVNYDTKYIIDHEWESRHVIILNIYKEIF